MSRVINPNALGKEREHLVKAIVLALRELAQQSSTNEQTHDLTAFVVLSLETIAATIDPSVQAWEKKGYWVKADRFRMDWMWTGQYAKTLREALLSQDWSQVVLSSVKIGGKLNNVKIPVRNRIGQPWVGAWKRLSETNV
ncbi:MAG: hypothetical protein H6636_11975 [Anaerolineales bacterium]|nr:hypothetical protein [Anaerolineales bacterium]